MNERRQDFELLQRFTREGEQSAFADVVRRHLDLVFGTAMRKVEDPGAGQGFWQAWLPGVQTIAAGFAYTVALRTDGTLWAWGANEWGQLGIGTFSPSDTFFTPSRTNTPQQVGTNADWHVVAVGLRHTVALRTDGSLWAWGYNSEGQLGNGTFTTKAPYGTNAPQQIGSDTNWQAVSASLHTVALRTDGTLWAWGENDNGELGNGTFTTNAPYGTNTPQQIGSDSNWQAGVASQNHTVALRADGTLWAWGSSGAGKLGTGSTNRIVSTPQQVGTNTNWGPPP